MNVSVSEVLSSRFNKDHFLSFIQDNPDKMEETFQLAFGSEKPVSWRAAWVLNHATSKNDVGIKLHAPKIIDILSTREDGHQRELLKLLEKVQLEETLEGLLFDKTLSIWEDIGKTPSVRIVAFRILVKIAKQFPELQQELTFFTQEHYIETLSPGIKNSLQKQLKQLSKNKT